MPMVTQCTDDLQAEAPPSKRARLEQSEGVRAENMDLTKDNHRNIANLAALESSNASRIELPTPIAMENSVLNMKGIPGLGLLGQAPVGKHTSGSREYEADLAISGPISTPQSPSSNRMESSERPAPIMLHGQEAEVQSLQNFDAETENEESPSVTAALESLLGGLTPANFVEIPRIDAGSVVQNVPPGLKGEQDEARLNNGSIPEGIYDAKPADTIIEPSPTGPPYTLAPDQDVQLEVFNVEHEFANQQEAEFEVDSSPIQSSSDDDSDSDDSSSSEDSEGEDDYKLLEPEEQARILMEGDGGSDDEGGGKGAKGSGGQLRTKNEVPEEIIPKPDVTITPEMRIEELGEVEAVVENILLIKAKTSGEYRVLESGSVLCMADRTVIGVVSETLGRVQQPLYSVRFTNADEIAKAGLAPRTKVFYSEQHSTYVFTQALKAYKGSDASNLHDEEVGDEEMEFSDDEAEAEHKRRVKQKKTEKRGGRMLQNSGSTKGVNSSQQQPAAYDPMVGLSYDDDDDGPYKPLSRPAGFADSVGRSEAPQEGVESAGRGYRGSKEDNSQSQPRESFGRGRGRGDRGRGRGDRGRGNDRGRARGGFQDRRNDAYSQPAHEERNNGYSQPPQGSPISPPLPVNNSYYYNHPAQGPYIPQQPHSPAGYPVPPFQQQQQAYVPQQQYPYPQQYAAVPEQPQPWGNMSSSPAGAYINPAFLGNQSQPAGQGQQWAYTHPQQRRDPAAERAFHEAQERLNILKNLSGNRGSM